MTHFSQPGTAVFWFRRDLRLEDNIGLFHALKSGQRVIPVFIFDTTILDTLNDRTDRRIVFMHREIGRIKEVLEQHYGTTLHVYHGTPKVIFEKLTQDHGVSAVYANEDYEPYASARDTEVARILEKAGVGFHVYKDHVIFAKNEIVKADGSPYTVFTPYSKQWLTAFGTAEMRNADIAKYGNNFLRAESVPMPSLEDLGFKAAGALQFPAPKVDRTLLKAYAEKRDIPAADATSHLGVHLRFGTISTRELVRQAMLTSPVFLNELIWREFFQQILWHFPRVVDHCFKPKYEDILWRNDEAEFAAWCVGMTGYPLVDAGMRELNATGFMHNRVRMVVASFLTKHLLIDWRWGEAWFAEKLLDYELASNNGNWQWAAGTGCDAAPYFRIFNPTEQARKFDPDGKYQRKWISDLGTSTYPLPIVDHKMARLRALETYKEALRAKV